jgi:hypothetical protein
MVSIFIGCLASNSRSLQPNYGLTDIIPWRRSATPGNEIFRG